MSSAHDSSATERKRILLVTDLGFHLRELNGFVPRVLAFVRALAAVATVEVVVLQSADSPLRADAEPGSIRGLESVRVRTVRSPNNPLYEPSLLGKVRRAIHYSAGRFPAGSFPRQLALAGRPSKESYDVAVYYLPSTAHLARRSPAETKTICVLEEGLERVNLQPSDESRPVRSNVAGAIVHSGESRRWRRLYRDLARRDVRVVAISEDEAKWFAEVFSPERITVFPHGIDLEYYSPEPEEGAQFDCTIVGDFRQQRNRAPAESLLTNAFAMDHAAWRWAVVGAQWPDAPPLPGTPVVTGFVDDVRAYYRSSRIVVVPTVDGTGVKTTLLQAWAMRRPVVATEAAVRGTPARHGENVLIGATAGDLLKLCGELLESAALRERLAAAGRTTAELHCDIRKVADSFAAYCLNDVR